MGANSSSMPLVLIHTAVVLAIRRTLNQAHAQNTGKQIGNLTSMPSTTQQIVPRIRVQNVGTANAAIAKDPHLAHGAAAKTGIAAILQRSIRVATSVPRQWQQATRSSGDTTRTLRLGIQ